MVPEPDMSLSRAGERTDKSMNVGTFVYPYGEKNWIHISYST